MAPEVTEGGRPQDQERSHKRKGRPSAETARLLTAWQDALRAELRMIVEALGERKAKGLGLTGDELVIALDDPRRSALVSRGIAIARELGASIDETPPDPNAPGAPPRPPGRRRKVDYGGA